MFCHKFHICEDVWKDGMDDEEDVWTDGGDSREDVWMEGGDDGEDDWMVCWTCAHNLAWFAFFVL